MNKKTNDDPRQILEILNSLGVTGVTASELKDFMKELKLYRKVKRMECLQFKEEIKTKILRKQEYINSQVIKDYKVSSIQSTLTEQKENTKDIDSSSLKTNISEILANKTKNIQNVQRCMDSDLKERVSTVLVSVKCSKNSSCSKKAQAVEIESLKDTEEYATSSSCNNQNLLIQPECKRAKSARSESQKSGFMNLQSRSKSFIRPRNLKPESKLLHNKKASDPVALYQKYKMHWQRLSLPGEQNHDKLRWAIREKMLGSNRS